MNLHLMDHRIRNPCLRILTAMEMSKNRAVREGFLMHEDIRKSHHG